MLWSWFLSYLEQLTSAAKAAIKLKLAIAALKRCATQKQDQKQDTKESTATKSLPCAWLGRG